MIPPCAGLLVARYAVLHEVGVFAVGDAQNAAVRQDLSVAPVAAFRIEPGGHLFHQGKGSRQDVALLVDHEAVFGQHRANRQHTRSFVAAVVAPGIVGIVVHVSATVGDGFVWRGRVSGPVEIRARSWQTGQRVPIAHVAAQCAVDPFRLFGR